MLVLVLERSDIIRGGGVGSGDEEQHRDERRGGHQGSLEGKHDGRLDSIDSVVQCFQRRADAASRRTRRRCCVAESVVGRQDVLCFSATPGGRRYEILV